MTKCFHGVLPNCHLNARAIFIRVALSELILPTKKVKQILSTSVAGRPSMHLPENNFQSLILEVPFISWVMHKSALCVAQLMGEEEVDGSECVSKNVQMKCLVYAPASLINNWPIMSGSDFQEVLCSLKVRPQSGQ